jgi:hypothetical protein
MVEGFAVMESILRSQNDEDHANDKNYTIYIYILKCVIFLVGIFKVILRVGQAICNCVVCGHSRAGLLFLA